MINRRKNVKESKENIINFFINWNCFGRVSFNAKPTISDVNNISKNNKSNLKIDIDITDNFFIAQTNDVYINYSDYEGKIVRIEGYFYVYQDYNSGENYYAVVRNSPGCCGNDGLAGLDIKYDGEYPAEKTWIRVVGKISKYSEQDPTPVIIVSSLEETKEGTGFVNQ